MTPTPRTRAKRPPLARLLAPLLLPLLALGGCANGLLPAAHRHPLQQGNLLSAEQIDRLALGMSESQVRYLLGNPITANTAGDGRWLYTFSAGRLVEPGPPALLALRFDGGQLAKIDNRYQIDEALSAYYDDVLIDFD